MEFDKLILKNISLDINKKSILKNININIKHNKIHSFYGKSGSGKTSLLNIMNFLYIPTNGSIYYDGKQVVSTNEETIDLLRNKEISYFQQELSFIEDITLWDNFTCFAEIKGIQLDEEKIYALADKLDIKALLYENVSVLSGGERQRAAFLKLLFLPSSLILIDEPTNNLDKENIIIILDAITLLKEEGKTIVVVSHSEEIEKISDFHYRMEDINA